MNCAKCRAPLAAHFKVAHIGRDGTETVSAQLCSLTCMLGWAQDYAAQAGMRIAIGVQQKIASAKHTWEMLKGLVKGS